MDTWFPTFRKIYVSLPAFMPDAGNSWPLHTTAAQRQALLRLIATAQEENLPLLPLLENWTADQRGLHRQRLNRLLELLHSDMPLADALEATPGILSDE